MASLALPLFYVLVAHLADNNLAIRIYTQSTLSMIYLPLQQSLVSSVAKYD